jgi:hypothetical protein
MLYTTNFRLKFQTLTANAEMEFSERSSHLRSGLHAGHQVTVGTAIVHQDHRILGVAPRCPEGYVSGDKCLLRAATCKVQRGSCFSPDSVPLDLW